MIDALAWLRGKLAALADADAYVSVPPTPKPKTPPNQSRANDLPPVRERPSIPLPRLRGETDLAYQLRASVPPCTIAIADDSNAIAAFRRWAQSRQPTKPPPQSWFASDDWARKEAARPKQRPHVEVPREQASDPWS